MPTPEQILMRKIKKREKMKIQIIAKKNIAREDKTEIINGDHTKDVEKRLQEDIENNILITKNKKKKRHDYITEETLDNTSGTESSLCVETSEQTFCSVEGISEPTLKAIKDMGFTKMTEIQAKSLPLLLKYKDVLATAKTGSGKTLAFLLQVIHVIEDFGFKPRNGTGAIILSPTRELAMQTFGVLNELMKYHRYTYGLIMGSNDKKREDQKLCNGVNIVVATPGRLLHHLKNSPDFHYRNLLCLVIDEADRMLQIGFRQEMKVILDMLPKKRQTIVFSATLSDEIESLSNLACQFQTHYVTVNDMKQATVDKLEQDYVICPSEKRFLVLFSALKEVQDKKVMVFFSTCMAVEFYHKLLNCIGLPCIAIHGQLPQAKRTTTFFRYSNAESGILLCTDIAARGLDIPAVDMVIQFDPPTDYKEYIHRVGRTARGLNANGMAILFLRQEEIKFLSVLKWAKVNLKTSTIPWHKVEDIQGFVEDLISNNKKLRHLAMDAFRSYIRSYESHPFKAIFSKDNIDLAKVAKSFGLIRPPPPVNTSTKEPLNRKNKDQIRGKKSGTRLAYLNGR